MIDLLQNSPTYLLSCSLLFGLVIGSFLNVVVHRMPIMMERDFKEQAESYLKSLETNKPIPPTESGDNNPEAESFNLITPNSSCPRCQHEIRAYENIPVLSYLLLKGKCSNCQAPISLRYPMVELFTGLISVFLAWHFGFSYQLLFALILTYGLITQALIDWDTQYLLDDITFPLLWLGLIINTQGIFASLEDAVIGAAVGYLSLWSVFWVYKILTKKEGMGYGDFKLMALLGAWLGWQYIPLIILLSSVTGSIIGGAQIFFAKDKNADIPISFGPYIASAGWIAFIWGDTLLNTYLGVLST